MERLVRLAPEDAGEVLTLQRASYVTEAQAHGDLDLPPLRQDLASVATELADPQVLALGWRDVDGRLVAAVRARTTGGAGDVGQAWAEVGRLTVVPDRQGQGLGTRLLMALEQRLPAEVIELRLFTGEHSHANLRLYRRLGYVDTGRQAAPAGYDVVHLAKPRRPAP